MVSSGISDVLIASVHSEKTSLKKLMKMMMMIIIIMNKSQDMMTFKRHQKLTSAMKLRPEKCRLQIICSIEVSLHREPPEVGLVIKLSRSLYWWAELCVPSYIESAPSLSDYYMNKSQETTTLVVASN